MINLIIGIAIGAAFSSFWIKLWNYGKTAITTYIESKKAN